MNEDSLLSSSLNCISKEWLDDQTARNYAAESVSFTSAKWFEILEDIRKLLALSTVNPGLIAAMEAMKFPLPPELYQVHHGYFDDAIEKCIALARTHGVEKVSLEGCAIALYRWMYEHNSPGMEKHEANENIVMKNWHTSVNRERYLDQAKAVLEHIGVDYE